MRLLPTLPCAILSALVFAACGTQESPSSRPQPEFSHASQPLAGEASSAPSASAQLRAKEVASSADLIGGLRADGRLGDYLLANDQIRVIIQDIDHAAQFYIFGGNIVDADVVRPAGEAGKDLLAEFFVDLNLTHTLQPERIEVVKDGTDGQEARIRVTGTDFPWPILPGKDPVEPMPVRITQDYLLHPGEKFVTIETTVENTGSRSMSLLKAELLLVGSSLHMAAGGLPAGEIVGRTPYITMTGSQTVGASYAYIPDRGSMTVPFEDAAQTGALLGTARLRPGESHRFHRYFLVGDRDAAAVTDTYFALRGERTGVLEGRAVDPSGAPVEEAQVVITDRAGNYLTQSLSRADGSFRADLPPGEVTLTVTAAGRTDLTSSPLSITAGKTTSAALTLNPQGRVAFHAVDETGRPCPVRATFSPEGGGRSIYKASYAGGESMAITPGTYRVTFSRGIEYSISQHTVTVPASGEEVRVPADSPAVLRRVIDTTGWLSGDFHLHQKNSNDSWMLIEDRVSSLLAEGVEVGVPTDHDHVTDFGPTLERLELTGMLVTGVGNEVSIVDYGHFNYFPVGVDESNIGELDGTQYWFSDDLTPLSASELFLKMRQNPGNEVIQINHPRDGASGYFSMIGYDADTGRAIREPLATDFDALEVHGQVFGEESLLPDYFSLLNLGLKVAAMGNSDAHTGPIENGYPRTFLRVADDRPAVATMDDVVAAIQGGHTVVSAGIFVDLKAKAGTVTGGPGDKVFTGGNLVTLTVRLQCPSWTTMSRFQVYANGEPLLLVPDGNGGYRQSVSGVAEQALAPVLTGGRYEQTIPIAVTPSLDTYYSVLAWGDGSLGYVAGDHTLGYTSPVYVDLDGVGFRAPGRGAPVGPAPKAPAGWQPKRLECGDGEAE